MLGNDYYEEALLIGDRVAKKERLERALRYANDAKKYVDENGNKGFSQCTATTVLITKSTDELAKLQPNTAAP